MLESIFHFQMLGALEFFVLMIICFSITGAIAERFITDSKRSLGKHAERYRSSVSDLSWLASLSIASLSFCRAIIQT
ncbi:MAG: hypothetical protein EBR00_02075 [Gammaproteobacteria bacterium]|nr:hypothetical protein [Gammaproteobacteria bacterium]